MAVAFVSEGAVRHGLDFDPDADPGAAAAAYLAPVSSTTVRMVQPDGLAREFDRDPLDPDRLVGAYGWLGEETADGVVFTTGRDVPKGAAKLVFEDGRLRRFERKGRTWSFPAQAMPIREGSVRDLWPTAKSRRQAMKDHDAWRNTGRLRLWFVNPNRAGLLFAELGLLALALLALRRRWANVVGLIASAVCFYMIVRTGSRGGIVAFLAGASVLAAFRARRFFARVDRRTWMLAGIVALCGVFIFLSGAPRVTRHLLSPKEGSNRIRLQILRAVPRMMVDAPDGWGWYSRGMVTGAGKAYVDWYQPMKTLELMSTLVSDHLTQLVNRGWFGRFGYLAAWLSLLAVLVVGAIRGMSPLPLTLWTAFLIATGLNRVMEAVSLWVIPVAVTLAALPGFWRTRNAKWLVCALAAALATAGLTLGWFWTAGSRQPMGKRDVPVRTEQNRIFVKDTVQPKRWIVDDGAVLGGGLAANEMRYHYQKNRQAPGVGYALSVFDLPKDVHQVVLAGMSGWDFLMGLNDGKFPADFNVPEEILFISPPFPPEAVPELLRANARVKIVIGEFAAAYFKSYINPPDWVTVVPGAELYIPGWTGFVIGK